VGGIGGAHSEVSVVVVMFSWPILKDSWLIIVFETCDSHMPDGTGRGNCPHSGRNSFERKIFEENESAHESGNPSHLFTV
jgi:hypothetical protein